MMIQKNITKGLSVLLLVMTGFTFGQSDTGTFTSNDAVSAKDTAVDRLQVYDGFDFPSDFKSQYRSALRRVRRVYPLALEAARVIDSLDQEMESLEKNRKKRRLMRKTHRSLKDDFKYLLKDLYISEGKVLTKLIYRETGMTVAEIISDYRNGLHSAVYSGVAGFFEQDLDAKYYPDTEDFVIECVVRDIKSGKVAFDPSIDYVSKKEYKAEKKRVRKQKTDNQQKMKEFFEEIERKKEQAAQEKKKAEAEKKKVKSPKEIHP